MYRLQALPVVTHYVYLAPNITGANEIRASPKQKPRRASRATIGSRVYHVHHVLSALRLLRRVGKTASELPSLCGERPLTPAASQHQLSACGLGCCRHRRLMPCRHDGPCCSQQQSLVWEAPIRRFKVMYNGECLESCLQK